MARTVFFDDCSIIARSVRLLLATRYACHPPALVFVPGIHSLQQSSASLRRAAYAVMERHFRQFLLSHLS